MLVRGKYGVEYNPHPVEDDSNGLGWLVVVVMVAAAVSLSWSLFSRFRQREAVDDPQKTEEVAAPNVALTSPHADLPQPIAADVRTDAFVAQDAAMSKRPVKVRNLLMRLAEAEKNRDVEMAISTIELLRDLPGAPAADLDNSLARRLGTLNVRRLFEQRSAQWVEKVVVKRGDSASRIAAEHGATFASLARLNGGIDLNRVRIGQTLYVLKHPRFNLVVHRRARIADLHLNGKFFKRYDLTCESVVRDGAYEWRDVNLSLKPVDRTELDVLLPKATPVLVSEM